LFSIISFTYDNTFKPFIFSGISVIMFKSSKHFAT
jgi:hypothetical protein